MISKKARAARWPLSPAERFWTKVSKTERCWLWTGKNLTKPKSGYGRLEVNGQMVLAHRFAWELGVGPVPPGQRVLHRCDEPLCVRFDHLFLGTQLDNIADRVSKGRTAQGERAGNARLTDQQVREIRASTEQAKIVARRFGISHWYVYNLRYRRDRKSA